MTTYLRIPDKIQQLSEGEIQKIYVKPYIPAFFMLVGMALIWFGGREAAIKSEESYLMTILGSVVIVLCVVALLLERHYFMVKSSMTPIKPVRINLDMQHEQKILELITDDQINEILRFSTSKSSPLCLEVWYTKRHNKVYTQLFYYYDAGMRPISLVHVTKLIDLDIPLLEESMHKH